MIGVLTNQEFIDAWNSMEGDVDKVYLYLHGGTGVLYFYKEELRFSNSNNTTSSLSFDDLEKKQINDTVYLLSCNGGQGLKGNNVAFMFAEKSHANVRACTGHVSYSKIFGVYFARKALDFGLWYTYAHVDSWLGFSYDIKY